MWGAAPERTAGRRHRPPIAPNGTPFARTPLVVAMPAPMADAPSATPHAPIGWSDLEQLARRPRAAGARTATRNGGRSGSARATPTGRRRASTRRSRSTPRPRPRPRACTRTVRRVLRRFDRRPTSTTGGGSRQTSTARALTYLSAVDHRRALRRRVQLRPRAGRRRARPGHASRPALPLVAVYPERRRRSRATTRSSCSTRRGRRAAARAGARLFTRFALQPAGAGQGRGRGLPPGTRRGTHRPARTRGTGSTRAHGTASVAPASPVEIEQRARALAGEPPAAPVCSLLFDVSDSMGDPADPARARRPDEDGARPGRADERARPTRARRRGRAAHLHDRARRIRASPNWSDVVPIAGRWPRSRPALRRAIAALTPQPGSPLYAATRGAYDAVARARRSATDQRRRAAHRRLQRGRPRHRPAARSSPTSRRNPTSASSRSRTATTPTSRR